MTNYHLSRRMVIGSALSLAVLPRAAKAADPDAAFGDLLKKYVSTGRDGINRVDYRRWHADAPDRQALAAYIALQEGQRPSQLARPQAFAFWANLYNSLTLKVILDNYPVKSIRDIRSQSSLLDLKALIGPWRTQLVKIEGKSLSLDDIEHGIMRPTFADPRVHYAVNCASIGCPNLQPSPWSAATLDSDLDAAARAFVNHPRAVTVKADGSLKISSIYRWFIEDFGGNDAGILRHLRQFANADLAERLSGTPRISEDAYDWTLNAPGTGAS